MDLRLWKRTRSSENTKSKTKHKESKQWFEKVTCINIDRNNKWVKSEYQQQLPCTEIPWLKEVNRSPELWKERTEVDGVLLLLGRGVSSSEDIYIKSVLNQVGSLGFRVPGSLVRVSLWLWAFFWPVVATSLSNLT